MSQVTSSIVVIMGPPGSGKGTQGDLLEKNGAVKKISTGDILRDHVQRQTELGKKIASIIDSGSFVSDSILAELVQEELRLHIKKPVLLDGYPRNLNQAKDFSDSPAFSRLAKVISLEVSDEFLIERILGRRVCSACGYTFHIGVNSPQREGICDHCGGSLVVRNDDTQEKIEKRLAIYQRETLPLLSYYKEQGLLETVDGRASPTDVHLEISNKLSQIYKSGLKNS